MNYRILMLDTCSISDEEMEKLYAIYKADNRESCKEIPMTSKDEFFSIMREKWENTTRVRCIATDSKGDWVAAGRIEFPTPGTDGHEKRHGWLWLHVLQEHRRNGLGTAMLLKFAQICQENDIEKIGIEFADGAGTEFCRKLGANLDSQRHAKLLKLKEANWEKAKEWQKDSVAETEGVRLEYYLDIPEKVLPEFLSLYNICEADATDWTEDVEHIPIQLSEEKEYRENCKKKNKTLFAILARDACGRLVGMTEIQTLLTEPLMIQQQFTGVVKSFRGKGLGKWLKAEMLLWIRDNIPNADCMITGNNDFNHGVNQINYSLGYKDITKKFHVQLDVAQLLKKQ